MNPFHPLLPGDQLDLGDQYFREDPSHLAVHRFQVDPLVRVCLLRRLARKDLGDPLLQVAQLVLPSLVGPQVRATPSVLVVHQILAPREFPAHQEALADHDLLGYPFLL